MSCVVALTDRGSTWIASDSLLTAADATWTLPHGKWTELPCGLWIGLVGSHRVYNLVEQLVEPSYDVPGLALALRNVIQSDGWKPDQDTSYPPAFGIGALIARAGEVWELCGNFTLIPIPKDTFTAIGSGRQYATGACFSSRDLGISFGAIGPASRVAQAVEAAIAHDTECGPPVYLEHLP